MENFGEKSDRFERAAKTCQGVLKSLSGPHKSKAHNFLHRIYVQKYFPRPKNFFFEIEKKISTKNCGFFGKIIFLKQNLGFSKISKISKFDFFDHIFQIFDFEKSPTKIVGTEKKSCA